MSTSLHLNPFPSFSQGSDTPSPSLLSTIPNSRGVPRSNASCGSLATRPGRSSEATEMTRWWISTACGFGSAKCVILDDPARSLWTRTSADIGVFDSRPYPASITFRSPLPSSPLSGTCVF
ncbi:hypothetical protein BDZ97DRAFT_1790336, partial [Flammula alnicola]